MLTHSKIPVCEKENYTYVYIYIHTHTHTHTLCRVRMNKRRIVIRFSARLKKILSSLKRSDRLWSPHSLVLNGRTGSRPGGKAAWS
jgi:hypothetical protein